MSQNKTQNINAVLTILQGWLDGDMYCGNEDGPIVDQDLLNLAMQELQLLEEKHDAN